MKTFSRSLVALAAITVVSLTTSASFAEDAVCGSSQSWAQFKEKVESTFAQVKTQEIKGSAKESLVAQYNATPPALTVDPDEVRVLTRPESPTALVVYSKESCVLGAGYIPVEQLVRIMAMGPKGIEV